MWIRGKMSPETFCNVVNLMAIHALLVIKPQLYIHCVIFFVHINFACMNPQQHFYPSTQTINNCQAPVMDLRIGPFTLEKSVFRDKNIC